ncbi:MAG: multi-sensor hybrid histidine kinase [Bryobacterales bacterium]|nr:multi-sensor hybrid histidine kinase [Bryobacterales bacterium]
MIRQLRPSLAIGGRLLAGFGVGLAAFIALSVSAYRSTGQLAETSEWVRHTHEVLAKLEKVDSNVMNGVAAVRGFVITGQESFLLPYRRTLQEQENDERTLRRLIADNPRQQARFIALENLIVQWRAFSEETLGVQRQRGATAAAALISTGRGEEIMKDFQTVIAAMEREERNLLTGRESQARASTARMVSVISVGILIDLALLLTVLFLFIAEAGERRDAEAGSRLAAEIVKSTSDAVITLTLGGVVTSWSPGAEAIFGYTAPEVVGLPMQMLIPPDCKDDETELLARVGRGETVEHFETTRLRKDGRRANVSVTLSPLRDDAGRVSGAAKILRDCTERKEAEERSRQSEERFRTMANSIPQLAWIAHADGFVYWYNERWYEYTGTSAKQMEGWGWQTVHEPLVLPQVMENWTAAIGSGQPFEMVFPLRGADGRSRTFLTRVQPLKSDDGCVVQWFGTNTDVDELKLLEESLHASQMRLTSALAAGSIGTWSWDIANDCLTADEFAAATFSVEPGAAAQGLPAEVYLRSVVTEDQQAVRDGLARAIECRGSYDIEYRVRKDGELCWIQARGRVAVDAAGKALSFHGAVMDLTTRKRTEGRFRRLVESNAQGVMFWNRNGEITEANEAFLGMVGYTREDLSSGNLNWVAMTPPEYAYLDDRSSAELADRGVCAPFEKEFIRKDGSRLPVLLGAAVFEDTPGEGVCFVLDIADRKRTDQALRQSEERFHFLNDLSEARRMLSDAEPMMALTARMLGEHLRVSRCAYADVEQDGEHFIIVHDYTDGCPSAVGGYQLSSFGPQALATLRSGQTLTIRNVGTEFLPDEGADMFRAIGIQALVVCPLVRNGALLAMMAVHQTTPREWTQGEITLVQDVVERCWAWIERRAAEEDIRRLNAELEGRVIERTAEADASNRAKSVFLSTMSHEIRTPMNAILGYSQLMLRDPLLGKDAQENLAIINRSGEHLLALINDVLDMSRIEAGRVELNPTVFSVSALLEDVAGMFRLRAEAKHLRFEVLVDGESAPYILADQVKIRQVLINLLGNAIKFTNRGYTRLHVTLGRAKANNLWLSARVEDTGPGISDEDKEKLFQSFSQAKGGTNNGTGLGLAISRAFARLMGGDLTLSSSPGAGSIFRFEIPVERGDGKVAIRQGPSRRVMRIRAGQEAPRILIADDLHENRDWLMKLLTEIGFSVRCSDDGESAIREWRDWAPHLILMDVHMPVINGLEATRRIKASQAGKDTAIIIISASVLDHDRLQFRESGADDFLAKPCHEDALLEKMRILLPLGYDYEGSNEVEAQPELPLADFGEKPITNYGQLRQLPGELIEGLRDATLNGDKKLLNKLIARLDATQFADIARKLQDLSDGYEYDALIRFLEEGDA